MPIILCNDIHADDRGPASRTDDWLETCREKLAQIEKVAVKLRANAICIAGDLFHSKKRHSMAVLWSYLAWAASLRRHDVKVLAIAGNHDLRDDRLDSLPRQPLGVLFASSLVHDVATEPARVGRFFVAGVPFPDASDLSNYYKVPEPPLKVAQPLRPSAVESAPVVEPIGVLMAHYFAEAKPRELPNGETVLGFGDINVPGYQIYHFGHDHSDRGVHQIDNRRYVQIGAVTRGSLAQDELTREPKIAVVYDDGRIELLRLACRPAEAVFDVETKRRVDQEAKEIEEFVQSLGSLDAEGSDLPAHIAALGLPDDVRERVNDYLERAESQ